MVDHPRIQLIGGDVLLSAKYICAIYVFGTELFILIFFTFFFYLFTQNNDEKAILAILPKGKAQLLLVLVH